MVFMVTLFDPLTITYVLRYLSNHKMSKAIHRRRRSDFIEVSSRQNCQCINWLLKWSIRLHCYSSALCSSFLIRPFYTLNLNRLIQSETRTTLTERVPFPLHTCMELLFLLLSPPKMSQFQQNAVRCHLLNPLPFNSNSIMTSEGRNN